VLSISGPAADALSRRSPSSGRTVTVPGTCRTFGYDRSDGKSGLRLWQDPAVRRVVFNQIFRGPLTPGLRDKAGALKLVLSQGLAGIDTAADGGYPPTIAPGCE
jgi:hypothetical protein